MPVKLDVKGLLTKAKTYWRRPSEGRYMPIREIAAVSVGGLGVRFITNTVVTMIVSTGNVLIGNTIGIPPMPLYFMYLFSVFANIPLTTLRAKIVDYSHLKTGKYRPFVFFTAIPTALLGIGFVLAPYDRMTLFGKCAVVLAFNVCFQFFYYFLYDSNENLVNVLSPNTYERSDVYSVKSIVDSLAPSITNIIVPLIAKAVTGEETIYDMRVYRAVYPPILVVGVLLSVFIYAGTREKIVQPKHHRIRTPFFDTLKTVARNKYFWIISLASCLGFLEASFFNVLGWMYNYQKVCSAGQFALITTIYGNASFWAMLFTPALVRRFGKRNLLVFSNVLNILFIALMFPVVRSSPTNVMIWMFLGCLFLNAVVSQITVTITPSINGDIRDYQQFISGERVDGIFAVAGLIGSVWNLATASILPAIYDRAGLNAQTAQALGYSTDNIYAVLYNEQYFRSICGVLILASVLGASLNVLPYFFYDLTENRQAGMIAVLKIRAMLEDDAAGVLEPQTLREAVEHVERAEAMEHESRIDLRQAKRSGGRRALRQARRHNADLDVSHMILSEIRFFDTPHAAALVARAQRLTEAGPEHFFEHMDTDLQAAKAMPKRTAEEKENRRAWIEAARDAQTAARLLRKHGTDGLTPFDEDALERLFSAEDAADEALQAAYAQKDKDAIRRLRREKAQLGREIKESSKAFARYNRIIKPYRDAQKLLEKRARMQRLPALRELAHADE